MPGRARDISFEHFAFVINCSPEIMRITIDFDDFGAGREARN